MTLVPLASIRADKDVQPRAETDVDVVNDYAQAILDNAAFPPIVVFHDGKDYWLADGFHRFSAISHVVAVLKIPNPGTECEVREGTRRDAILYACGANGAHGLRRTNKDKNRAVRTMLKDPEWAEWNDSEIARHCVVSIMTVGRIRAKMAPNINNVDDKRKVKRGGKTYSMKRRGKNKASVPAPEPVQTDIEDITDPQPPAAFPVNDGSTPYDWYHGHLKAILDAIDALPPPDECARNYPIALCSALPQHRVLDVLRWWQEFARLIGARQPEFERYRARFSRKKESA